VNVAIAMHGGAGELKKYAGTGRLEEAEAFMAELLNTFHMQLQAGAAAIEVVEQAVVELEDCGLFHAGKGSSPSTNGHVEMDASIMDGGTQQAGGVALLRAVKNPIRLARIVMLETPHVLMAGQEGEALASLHKLEMVPPDYFVPCDVSAFSTGPSTASGTVGAVARDATGNMAAATSTGGTLRKAGGRIGDTPLIGAGTFAVNGIGAVSCTGYGEYFIRAAAAATVLRRVELLGESIGAAAVAALSEVERLGGSGGLICIGPRGEVAMPYNTSGMYRAGADAWGRRVIAAL
jgi:isoaspartyl peptidase/L-asparaginase-like protein (Ntn-hydrolase superfamily)